MSKRTPAPDFIVDAERIRELLRQAAEEKYTVEVSLNRPWSTFYGTIEHEPELVIGDTASSERFTFKLDFDGPRLFDIDPTDVTSVVDRTSFPNLLSRGMQRLTV